MENFLIKHKLFFIVLLSCISFVSIICVFVQLIWHTFDNGDGLAVVLLKLYIFMIILTFLNTYMLPKFAKNNTLYFIVNAIQAGILSLIISQKNLFISIPVSCILLVLVYIIVYFIQKAYTKRVNQKLNEYKQKNDDDKS